MSDSKFEGLGCITTRTIEECSELIHILCEIQRFGWFNYHPNNPNKENIVLVMDEIKCLEKRIEELKYNIVMLRSSQKE